MARYLMLSVLAAVLTTGFFYLVREFPVSLAALSGGSIGALTFAACTSLTRLYRQLKEPAMMVEYGEDSDDNQS